MSGHWEHSVAEHQLSTEAAIVEAAWALAQQRGPLAVNMSDVAAAAGLSRPTVYKYFSDVESMLVAYHRSHVAKHIAELNAIAVGVGGPKERLAAVLTAYGDICHARSSHGDREVDRLVHTGFEITAAEREVTELLARVIGEAARAGEARTDPEPPVLAAYCVRALGAAADVPRAEVAALVDVVRSSLTPA